MNDSPDIFFYFYYTQATKIDREIKKIGNVFLEAFKRSNLFFPEKIFLLKQYLNNISILELELILDIIKEKLLTKDPS